VKLLYMVLKNIKKKWTILPHGKVALNRFSIVFGGGFNDLLGYAIS
jgi:hypothetical protein